MATANPAAPVPTAPPHGGRRHYLIDLKFQLKYTALIVVFGGTIMGLYGGAVWREVRNNSELLEGRQIAASLGMAGPGATPLGDLHDAVALTDQRMLFVILGSALIVMAGLGLCGVLLTHRVAGPILVLNRYTRALGEGTFPKIRALRKGDELQGYFDTFREAVEKLQQQQKKELDALETVLAQLGKSPGAEAIEARELLAALAKHKRESLEGQKS
jgi:methyl-accepting chemotaxis protein